MHLPDGLSHSSLKSLVQTVMNELSDEVVDRISKRIHATTNRYFPEGIDPPFEGEFGFVIMPFGEEYISSNVYKFGICPAVELNGLVTHRVDEDLECIAFMHKVFSAIRVARIIVADLTCARPNVLYELGIAHALNRNVIVICDRSHEIPADLSHFTVLKYDERDIGALQSSLAMAIRQNLQANFEESGNV